jgi:FK506-binding protein 4/5
MMKGEKALLTVRPQYGFGAKGRVASETVAAVPPNSDLKIELELVSWKTVEEITDDKKVTKKILTAVTGYEKPNDGAVVKVKYVAKLQDGTIFEQKGQDGELFEFVVDEGRLVSLFFSMVYCHLMGSQLEERRESLTVQVLCRTSNCWSG